MSIPSSASSLNSNSQTVNSSQRPTGNTNSNNNNNNMNKNITSANDAIGIYDVSDRQTDGISVNSPSMNLNSGTAIYDPQKIIQHQHALSRGHYREHNSIMKHQNQNGNGNGYETDSPALISPTLTYSSHTPSTLSPATPFFGSFQGAQEVFASQGVSERPGLGASEQRAGSH
jgi:hypothetical protein